MFAPLGRILAIKTDGRISRCFVHLANSVQWNQITGQELPQDVPTGELYTSYGLPWFNYYSDAQVVEGGA